VTLGDAVLAEVADHLVQQLGPSFGQDGVPSDAHAIARWVENRFGSNCRTALADISTSNIAPGKGARSARSRTPDERRL
jgi:hypothetical protein